MTVLYINYLFSPVLSIFKQSLNWQNLTLDCLLYCLSKPNPGWTQAVRKQVARLTALAKLDIDHLWSPHRLGLMCLY